jgi:hypothetical protein
MVIESSLAYGISSLYMSAIEQQVISSGYVVISSLAYSIDNLILILYQSK